MSASSSNRDIIGRASELVQIDRLMQTDRSEFLAVYGRRRVGKTFLIRQYLKSDIVFFFTGAYNTDTSIQIQNFFTEYLRQTKEKKETVLPEDWNMAFDYLAQYLKSFKRRKRKAVVFIDELPWADNPKSGFMQALEYFWNSEVSAMNHVLLIVCGSAASWMQNKLLKSTGGLYNRVTARLKLEPFTLHETELYCKKKHLKLSRYQILQLYMAMGGIPFYLNELSPGKSAEQLINEVCFRKNGLLSDEYDQLYHSLFKNAETHIQIVETLAKHHYGLTRVDLLEKSKLDDGGTFSRALNDLSESGFVLVQRPFGKRKKDSIYLLIDLYSLFYLRFIRKNAGKTGNVWHKQAGSNAYKTWSGYAYENVCMLHTSQIVNALGLGGAFTEISSWIFRGNDEVSGAQIDLLIDRKDGVINLCEVKFTENEFILSKNYTGDLRRKRSVFEHVTATRKSVVTTLITTYPALKNQYYLEEIHSEITMDDLFKE